MAEKGSSMKQEENWMDNIKNEVGDDFMATMGKAIKDVGAEETDRATAKAVESAFAQLFKDNTGEPFASIVVKGKEVVMAMDSKTFKEWVTMVAHQNEIKPSQSTVTDAITLLRAETKFNSDVIAEVYQRVARDPDGNIWIYSGSFNEPSNLKISPDGKLSMESNTPIKFAPSKLALAFPSLDLESTDYKDLGNIMLLKNNLNIDDAGFYLTIVFIIQCFIPDRNYVILQLLGEHGSGKSFFNQLLRLLIDPSGREKTSPPKNTDDLIVSAVNGHLLDFDNISRLNNNLSDDFCRLSTGGSLTKRKNYSDRDEIVLKARRPIIINGISAPSTQPDLMQRSIVLNLPVITKPNRIHPAHIETAFESTYKVLFGCLMNLTAKVNVLINSPAWKKRMATVQFERMAEFHELGLAVEEIMDWPVATFEDALSKNILEGFKAVVDANPTATIVLKYVKTVFINGITSMEKSPTDWHFTFNDFLDNDKPLQKNLPKSADALGTAFTRIKPTLRNFGINLTKKEQHNNNLWVITKDKTYRENSSISSDSIPSDIGSVGTNNIETFQPVLKEVAPPREEFAPYTEAELIEQNKDVTWGEELEKEVLKRQDHTGKPWEENQN